MMFAIYIAKWLAIKNQSSMQSKLIVAWPNLIGHMEGSDVAPANHNAAKIYKRGTIM
jgi:hypothetical protein